MEHDRAQFVLSDCAEQFGTGIRSRAESGEDVSAVCAVAAERQLQWLAADGQAAVFELVTVETRHRLHARDHQIHRRRAENAVHYRIAPIARSLSCSIGIEISRGVTPARNAIAAATPAACPIAMHCPMLRTEAWASWSADRQRPAT